jgi:hypothetical protein
MAAGDVIVHEVMGTVVIEGIQYFTLSLQCTDAGGAPRYPLPDRGVFVYNIVDAGNPSDDTFARVVDIADFDAYPANRNLAITQGKLLWRATTATKNYTDFEVAVAAKQAFRDRINALAADWDTYQTEFLTPAPGDIAYPYTTADDTQVGVLETAYYDAFDAFVDAINDQTNGWAAKKAAYDIANQKVNDYAVIKGRLDSFTIELSKLTLFQTEMNTRLAAFRVELTTMSALDPPYATVSAYYDANIYSTINTTSLNYFYNVNVMGMSSYYTTNILNTTNSDYSTSLSARASAYSTLQTRFAELTAKHNDVTSKLSDVQTACPTFNPSRGYDSADLPAVPAMPTLP